MTKFDIAVLPGDGIGSEVMAPCVDLLGRLASASSAFSLEFTEHQAGAGLYLKQGIAIPQSAIDGVANADAVLLGAMGLPDVRYPDGTEVQPHLDLRERFKLYAGVRPIRVLSASHSPLADPRAGQVDAVLVRESTEGIVASRTITKGGEDAVQDGIRISRSVCERLFRFAFNLAMSRGVAMGKAPRLTCIDKANVIPSLAFFRQVFLEVAEEFPRVESDCIYVDAAGLQLVKAPWKFDVMVTENMFGDILSDVGAALMGGMGMAPSADIGDRHAIFQPCHGTAPDIAGMGLANPTAMILSGAMMLDWLSERHGIAECRAASQKLVTAVDAAFADGTLLPGELGGNAGTAEIVESIARNLDAMQVAA